MEEAKYNILIVDENQDQIDAFLNFFEQISSDFSVFSLDKLSNEDELFEFIYDNEIDMVAFDYKLMEANPDAFSQNGDIYQGLLLDHFENFPTFIITNNSEDAVYMRSDPFKIISKEVILYNPDDDEQKRVALDLVEKIIQSIDKYKENLKATENELLELITKQNDFELTDVELRRMVELDNKLESSISKKTTIPKEWKSPAGITAIMNLANNSENILAELKKINNE